MGGSARPGKGQRPPQEFTRPRMAEVSMQLVGSALFRLFTYRHILLATVGNDIRARYAGSMLGLAWLLIYPLLLLGTYATVYLCIFKIRFAMMNSEEYIVLIFC